MSIYAQPQPDPDFAAKAQAKKALHTSAKLLGESVKLFAASLDAVWNSTDPSVTLKALGTDAGQWVSEHESWLEFFEARLPGVTKAVASESIKRIKPTTTAEDGIVTLKT